MGCELQPVDLGHFKQLKWRALPRRDHVRRDSDTLAAPLTVLDPVMILAPRSLQTRDAQDKQTHGGGGAVAGWRGPGRPRAERLHGAVLPPSVSFLRIEPPSFHFLLVFWHFPIVSNV